MSRKCFGSWGPCVQKYSSINTSACQGQEGSTRGRGRWPQRVGHSWSWVLWLATGTLLEILGATLAVCWLGASYLISLSLSWFIREMGGNDNYCIGLLGWLNELKKKERKAQNVRAFEAVSHTVSHVRVCRYCLRACLVDATRSDTLSFNFIYSLKPILPDRWSYPHCAVINRMLIRVKYLIQSHTTRRRQGQHLNPSNHHNQYCHNDSHLLKARGCALCLTSILSSDTQNHSQERIIVTILQRRGWLNMSAETQQ